MTSDDLFQNLIGISIFALPILFMSTFTIGVGHVAMEWHSEFLIVIGGIAALFGFVFIKKLVQNWIYVLFGTLIFVAAYLNLIILVLDAFVGLYDPIVYPLFLLLIGFLLIYPLFEWQALADKERRDAMLPLQMKVEHFLEKLLHLARGRKVVISGFYVLVYGTVFSFLYWEFKDWVLAALIPALVLPLLNLGYLTGRGLGDDLLWWKEFRRPKEAYESENRFHWLVVDWDKKYLGIFQKISLGNKTVMGLGVILFVFSIYGLYTDVLTLTTSFAVNITVGLTLVAKTLILSGRNAVNETQKLLDATQVKEKPSHFSLFYPIYIGVAILLVLAVEFLVNVSGSVEQLATGLGIAGHRVLLAAILLGKELVMVLTAGMVVLRETQPISIREVREDEFNELAPVEQHIALQKWHQDVQTRVHPQERRDILEKTIQYAPDLLKVQFIIPFLNSSYYPLSSYAREEFETLLINNREVGNYCLRLLAEGALPFNTQITVTNLMDIEPYQSSLRELMKKGKIRTALEHPCPVTAVTVDENYLYSGAEDQMVRVWDKETWGQVTILKGHENTITSVDNDEKYLYSGAADSTVRVWDKTTWTLVMTLEGHTDAVTEVFVDEYYLYSGAADSTVLVWDKTTWTLVTTLDHEGPVWSVVADEHYLYSGVDDGTVRIWDKTTWALVSTLDHEGPVWSVVLDEHYIYAGAADMRYGRMWVWLWNKTTLTPETTLEGHLEPIKSLLVDKYYLYSGESGGFIVWDKVKLARITNLEPYTTGILSACADNKNVYAGAEDGTIKMWEKLPLRNNIKALLPYGLVVILFIMMFISANLFL